MKRLWGTAIVAVLAGSGPAAAEDPSAAAAHANVPTVRGVRAQASIILDGKLDDAVWTGAPAAGGFRQRDPQEGSPASEATEVRVAYDDEALYVGLRMHDQRAGPDRAAPVPPRRGLRRRRRVGLPRPPPRPPDRRAAPGERGRRAARRRALQRQLGRLVLGRGLGIGGLRRREGWTVEMRIPFSQLRFPRPSATPGASTCGASSAARTRRPGWSWCPRTESGVASRMAHLDGPRRHPARAALSSCCPTRRRAASYVEPSHAGDPFNDGSRTFGARRPGPQVRPHQQPHPRRHPQPRLRPGGGRPGGGEPHRSSRPSSTRSGRSSSRARSSSATSAAAAPTTSGASTTRSRSSSTRAASAARPQGSPDGDYVDIAAATTILGAAKLTGQDDRRAGASGCIEAVTGRERARTR